MFIVAIKLSLLQGALQNVYSTWPLLYCARIRSDEELVSSSLEVFDSGLRLQIVVYYNFRKEMSDAARDRVLTQEPTPSSTLTEQKALSFTIWKRVNPGYVPMPTPKSTYNAEHE